MPALVKVGQTGRENASPETSYFTDEYTYVVSTNTAIPHGLAVRPKQVWLELRCLIADLAYAVGDRLNLNSLQCGVSWNAANINVVTTATLPSIPHATTGAATVITAGSWALVIKAQIA